ncbi:MAG: polyhydroxyalkanoic acid system family protein [Thermoguttaceae bacterium]
MPLMKITVPHQLSQEEATRRLKQKHEQIKTEHTYTVSDLRETWLNDDAMDFAFKVLGFSLTGGVRSEPQSVTLSVDLPVVAMMMKGTIASQIEKELNQVLQSPLPLKE